MTLLRLPRILFSIPSKSFIANPFLILLFLYFLTSSADVASLYWVAFHMKLTNLLAFFCLGISFLLFRSLQIPSDSFAWMMAMFVTMVASLVNSPNLTVSIGFIIFFIFNYCCYFLAPYNFFRFFQPDTLMRVYAGSFYVMGIYAFCQIIASLGGIQLPGVRQTMVGMARGQGLSYEPSYYALYMTSFAIFCTAKCLLEKKFKGIFWPNFFLLISTSTGCFFSYIFFLFFILLFRSLKIISPSYFSVKKIVGSFCIGFVGVFGALALIKPQLLKASFFKFFQGGGLAHFSILDRWEGLVKYWHIFLEHPIVGISFGVGPYYLVQEEGGSFSDLADPVIAALYSPMNVTTEVLASVGLLGSGCFLFFFYLVIRSFLKVLKLPGLREEERILLISFALSLCVTFSTLQFNQSIMRAYIWIHVGLFCGLIHYFQQERRIYA